MLNGAGQMPMPHLSIDMGNCHCGRIWEELAFSFHQKSPLKGVEEEKGKAISNSWRFPIPIRVVP